MQNKCEPGQVRAQQTVTADLQAVSSAFDCRQGRPQWAQCLSGGSAHSGEGLPQDDTPLASHQAAQRVRIRRVAPTAGCRCWQAATQKGSSPEACGRSLHLQARLSLQADKPTASQADDPRQGRVDLKTPRMGSALRCASCLVISRHACRLLPATELAVASLKDAPKDAQDGKAPALRLLSGHQQAR